MGLGFRCYNRVLQSKRERDIEEDLVGWKRNPMLERSVGVVIDGAESEEVGVSTGLPHHFDYLHQRSA